MHLIISKEECERLLKLLKNQDSTLRRKLLQCKKRKSTKYKKCIEQERTIYKELEKLIFRNYKIKNQELIEKL